MKKLFTLVALFWCVQTMAQSEESKVKEVVLKGYVNGVHNDGPLDDMRETMHPDFKMHAFGDNAINEITRDGWIERIEAWRKRRKDSGEVLPHATGDFKYVSINGNHASVEVNLVKEGKVITTDLIALYKFREGWRMVSKTFYRHPN